MMKQMVLAKNCVKNDYKLHVMEQKVAFRSISNQYDEDMLEKLPSPSKGKRRHYTRQTDSLFFLVF